MPLLTNADAAFVPGVVLTPENILRAELLAYGPNGSGYDLDLTQRTEIKPLNQQLEVYPTFSIANLSTVTVAIRSPQFDNDWLALEPDTLEISRQRIRLRSIDGNFYSRHTDFGRQRFGQRRPFDRSVNELRFEYTSGIDFTANTEEVKRLKAAMGQIIIAQNIASQAAEQLTQLTSTTSTTGTAGQRVTQKSVLQGRATIQYSDPAKSTDAAAASIKAGSSAGTANGMISDALALFRRYRMRSSIG